MVLAALLFSSSFGIQEGRNHPSERGAFSPEC